MMLMSVLVVGPALVVIIFLVRGSSCVWTAHVDFPCRDLLHRYRAIQTSWTLFLGLQDCCLEFHLLLI